MFITVFTSLHKSTPFQLICYCIHLTIIHPRLRLFPSREHPLMNTLYAPSLHPTCDTFTTHIIILHLVTCTNPQLLAMQSVGVLLLPTSVSQNAMLQSSRVRFRTISWTYHNDVDIVLKEINVTTRHRKAAMLCCRAELALRA